MIFSLKEGADLWPDKGRLTMQVSTKVVAGALPLCSSSLDDSTDLSDSIPNGDIGDAIEDEAWCPFSLFKYKGENNGAPTGKSEEWGATSRAFNVAAAKTAAGVSWFSLDIDGY